MRPNLEFSVLQQCIYSINLETNFFSVLRSQEKQDDPYDTRNASFKRHFRKRLCISENEEANYYTGREKAHYGTQELMQYDNICSRSSLRCNHTFLLKRPRTTFSARSHFTLPQT